MRKNGLSLIEVVIAGAILAMFVLPMFNTLIANHKGTAILKEEVSAVLLALEVVDQVKLIPIKYLEGIGEKELKDGEQPLWKFFKTTPLYNAIKSHPKEVKNVKGILHLKTSPLPKNYKRKLIVESKTGFFAKFSVKISYVIKDMKNKIKNRDLTISDILIEEQ